MNLREPPHLSVRRYRALRCLSLLLLTALGPKAVHSLPRSRSISDLPTGVPRPDDTPYLLTLGAPPLRFQQAPPPPDLVTRPPAGAPPVPALTPTEVTVAQANAAAAQPNLATARLEPTVAKFKPAGKAVPAKPIPPSILPDDTRPAVHAEDFLPFFQIPGTARSAGDVNVIVPASLDAPATAPLPPSSATYTQTLK